MILIAIDPGASGAIAWRDNSEIVRSINMPETPADILEKLTEVAAARERYCLIENVGYHVAGNNASASCKFARHCGHLEMALLAAGIPFQSIRPTKWQKALGVMPKDKSERKRHIKDLMQRLYPTLKVTLSNADALGILTYALDHNKGA